MTGSIVRSAVALRNALLGDRRHSNLSVHEHIQTATHRSVCVAPVTIRKCDPWRCGHEGECTDTSRKLTQRLGSNPLMQGSIIRPTPCVALHKFPYIHNIHDLIARKVILATFSAMRIPITVRRYPSVSRRLAYTAVPQTSWPSARAQRYLPRLLKYRASTSSAGEDAELFNELRRLAVGVEARKRPETVKTFRVSVPRIVDSRCQELKKIGQEYNRVASRNADIVMATIDIEIIRLCQNDPRARGWGPSKQISEAIRALEHRLDTDAVKPSSRLTPKEREIVKAEFSRYHKGSNALGSVWKVALSLGFLYWAFNVGASP